MAKLIFNKKENIKANLKSKYILKSKMATLKNMTPRLINLGKYPVPTGRILQRYAYKHNLSQGVPIVKDILSKGKVIGMDEPVDRSKPKKMLTHHEAVRRYPNMCPCKDSDGDGVVNMADCRPFNKKKQDTEFDVYDKKGNTRPAKDIILKDISGYIPIKGAKSTVEVESRSRKIETLEPKKTKFK